MTNVDLSAKIPNNVNLQDDKKLQRALERWQPRFMEWWLEAGPNDFKLDDIYLRTAVGVGQGGWANFDYVGGPAGPWVTPETHRLTERFKFFNRFAGGPETWKRKPLQTLARWRCRRDFYDLPIEKFLVDTLFPSDQLS